MINKYDIDERIFSLVVNVITFVNTIPKTPINLIFINQIIRLVTSMGANDQEADGAITSKDFLHCYAIVRKEGKETSFWLRIIEKTNGERYKSEAQKLIQEDGEIVAIISTIIRNTQKNNK